MIIAARVRELKLNLEDCRIKVNLITCLACTLSGLSHTTPKNNFLKMQQVWKKLTKTRE